MPKHSIVVDELRWALLQLPIRPSLKASLQSLATAARRPLANYMRSSSRITSRNRPPRTGRQFVRCSHWRCGESGAHGAPSRPRTRKVHASKIVWGRRPSDWSSAAVTDETQQAMCSVGVVRLRQTFDPNGGLYQLADQTRGRTMTMRKIIGAALIVFSLSGCAGATLPGDSDWSREYWRISDKKQSAG
jgi:hypothetical protein